MKLSIQAMAYPKGSLPWVVVQENKTNLNAIPPQSTPSARILLNVSIDATNMVIVIMSLVKKHARIIAQRHWQNQNRNLKPIRVQLPDM